MENRYQAAKGYTPHVTYWLREKYGGAFNNIKYEARCFSLIRSGMSNRVSKLYYTIPIDNILQESEIAFYLEFLNKLFKNKKVNPHFRFKVLKRAQKIFFILYVNRVKETPLRLVYLTAIRYISEFPEVVKEFYSLYKKDKVKKLDAQYKNFHIAHKVPLKKYNNLWGHGLIYYYSKNATIPPSLDQFNNKLIYGNFRTVHDLFK